MMSPQSRQRRDHHRLDRVHPVLGLVEDDRALGLEDLVGDLHPVSPKRSKISSPTSVSRSWNAGRQCMNLTAGLPVRPSSVAVDLVRREQLDPLVPDVRSPIETHTSVYRKSTPLTPSSGSSVSVIRAPVSPRSRARLRRGRRSARGRAAAQPDVHAQLAAPDQERIAHVVAGIAEVAVRDLRERLVAVLAHGQDVGQHLGRVELVGQPVPDRHAGVLGQRLDDLLVEAAVLDRRRTSDRAPAPCP